MPESPPLGTPGGFPWGQTPRGWGQRGLHPQEDENRGVQSTCLGKVQELQMAG